MPPHKVPLPALKRAPLRVTTATMLRYLLPQSSYLLSDLCKKKHTFQFNLGNLLPDLTLYPWVLGHKLRLYLHCQKVIINFGYMRQMLKEPTS